MAPPRPRYRQAGWGARQTPDWGRATPGVGECGRLTGPFTRICSLGTRTSLPQLCQAPWERLGQVVQGLFLLGVSSRLLRECSLSLCLRYFRVACKLGLCQVGLRPG